MGEVIKRGYLSSSETELEFNDINPQNTYTIKFFANFDIDDGIGIKNNQENGNSTFTTLSLSKLGSVKIEISYDEDLDLIYESLKLNLKINTKKADTRLLQVLNNINLQIQDEGKNIIKEYNFNNIKELNSEEGINKLLNNLESNTKYFINIKSTAKQGDIEKEIPVTYTLRSFITNKMPVELYISNIIITQKVIDMDVYINDKDGACLDGSTVIRLFDENDKEFLPDIEPEIIKK